ncbi:thiamine-phosphate kinase [Verrucomicrobiales bacterium BCK34]|nr:thiamine-phosphate kinase [Verrucomicrobiales bacterium BCK34]
MTSRSENERLRDIGEEALVERLIARLPGNSDVVAGAGDDCAIVRSGGEGGWQLLKTDCLIESVHFVAGTDPVLVGRKAFNRVLSDIAAMGGKPSHALVTIATDSDRQVGEIEGWYEGMSAVAVECGCSIVGGETAKLDGDGALLSIAMTGEVSPDRCVQRSGASIGDGIWVTGRLGGSFESGRHLIFSPRLEESRWLCERFKPSSMMDLSDGLGSDLPRLIASSGLGYSIDTAALPLHPHVTIAQAVTDGEDYELLMTMSREKSEQVLEQWNAAWPDLPLTRIGEVVAETEVSLQRGWEHYLNS